MTTEEQTAAGTPLDGGLWLVQRDFAVFAADHPELPQCSGVGRGHDPATCDQRGKHPSVPFTRGHTKDPEEIRRLLTQRPQNVGVFVGACVGPVGEQLVVLDSDRVGAIEDVAKARGQAWTPTMRVRTAKGYHDYLWAPADLKLGNGLGALKGEFDGDVRAGNAYVIGPGSLHSSGVIYTLENPEQPPIHAPDWLIEALTARPEKPAPLPVSGVALSMERLDTYTRKVVQQECDSIASAPDGDQNNTLNTAAFNLGTLVGAGALGESEARQHLLAAARAGNHPDGRAVPTVESGLRAGMAEPRHPWPPVGREHATNAFSDVLGPDLEDDLDDGEEPQQDRLIGKLPAAFYDRREVLKKIRQYAHAMCCSADVVLYATLARLSGMVDHRVKVDTGVKKPASLNLFVGVIDSSGSNKSSSNEVSEDLLEAPDDRDFLDGVPLGTGEGIAEAMMGEVEREDFSQLDKKNNPKVIKVREQVRHNLYFYQDEGEGLIRIGSRDGSSLWPSIRSAWQSGTLGQTNASAERRRFIKRGTYAMGMVVGFQFTNALVVLRDSITGTAQRFVWCVAIDPDIPLDPISCPDLDFGNPQDIYGPTLMTMPAEIKQKIRTELVLRQSGKIQIDPLDTHANLAKTKLAGLLALLDGARMEITTEDWDLAEQMWATSCELRTAILQRASREESAAAQAKRDERVEDAVKTHAAVVRVDARLETRARWCVKKIREGVRREQLMEKASSKWRKEVPAGYELAMSRGWLVEDDEGRAEVTAEAP
ncbi:bifunctional DNA primase/polymerase [Streptomyces sp. FL07-04A]|uniref:bifunctional DNA primase/polymerase n=1 Tax=Streptomyces sp. FL07-04A TaxID=3028658 RepID=UPI0029B12F5C|nr:bifunctional DNA primase/polymerase [Streptomyces sp. FL07-04A]MDX3578666.1 bifunctional DNA primase/polymerase [Streptomyces sp. FL07-04A]